MADEKKVIKSSALIGAIAVLGASLGAVKTAYSDDSLPGQEGPVALTASQMDAVTAGASVSFGEKGGLRFVRVSDLLLPAVQGARQTPNGNVSFSGEAIYIKIGTVIPE